MDVSIRRANVLDYSILHNVTPEGQAIGRFGDREFSEFVRDEFGHLLVYCGVAPCRRDGPFYWDALKDGEFIIPPGLIYRYRGREMENFHNRAAGLEAEAAVFFALLIAVVAGTGIILLAISNPPSGPSAASFQNSFTMSSAVSSSTPALRRVTARGHSKGTL